MAIAGTGEPIARLEPTPDRDALDRSAGAPRAAQSAWHTGGSGAPLKRGDGDLFIRTIEAFCHGAPLRLPKPVARARVSGRLRPPCDRAPAGGPICRDQDSSSMRQEITTPSTGFLSPGALSLRGRSR